MDLNFLKWIEHAGFMLRIGDKNVYLDPFKIRSLKEKADVIFITHSHFDHLSEQDLNKIAKTDTQFIAPVETAAKLRGRKVISVEPDKEYSVGEISFKTVAAYNTRPERLSFHPRPNNWVGYVIDANGTKVYHAGDTDFTEDLKDVEADVALIPIGGTYTMSVEEAIEAAWELRVKTVVPMHYKAVLGQSRYRQAEEKFRKEVKNSLILEQVQDPYYSM